MEILLALLISSAPQERPEARARETYAERYFERKRRELDCETDRNCRKGKRESRKRRDR